ncbi:molybdopterin-dependent oxidoreductase [Methanoplanus sp. FWC-SCC4]|uniref:Molybdopterin-dependent oxidoreductase n=1 Tax=Methanochimaera problematica TaxID=2609417 RepID=A0AA97FB76_9EURY|nr:molybdopterin-dependent oxidoreductase [Methanoplanus sp. FWC-SCC4]WOF16210.1 molybdopterin-dependent oxidoreductase [Methanoplanus sp. FWC-SCC4]
MELKYVTTVCPFCATGCSFNLVVRDGRVVGAAPFQRSVVCDGKTCQKGHFAYELVNSEGRLKTPLVKRDGELVEATWEEALGIIADRCRDFSGNDIAVISSANATNEDIFVLGRLAKEVFKTENFTSMAAFGVNASAGSIAGIAKADCIVAVGNIAESHPLIARRIGNAIDKGAKVIAIDSYESPMAVMATEFVKSAPGAEIEAISDAAKFVEGENIVVLYPVGMSSSEAAVAKAASKLAEEKGGVFCALPAQSNGRGAIDLGAAEKSFSEVIDSDSIKAYYVMGEDLGPIDAGFVVVQDSFMTGTAKTADVVLPAAVFAEVDGTFTNAERRIQLLRKAQEPSENVKANWQIVCEVALKLGQDFGYETSQAIFGEICPGITYEEISKDGYQTPAGESVIADESAPALVSATEEYPYVLVTGPTAWHGFGGVGTLSENCQSLLREVPGMFVKINTEDAKELDLLKGASVRVITEIGEIKAPVKITDEVEKGIIFVPTMCIGNECICMLTGKKRARAAKIEREV